MKAKAFTYFCCFQRTIDTMTSGGGGQASPFFRRYGRELDSKPAISFKKSWGRYRRTTQRMSVTILIPTNLGVKDPRHVQKMLFLAPPSPPLKKRGACRPRSSRCTRLFSKSRRREKSLVENSPEGRVCYTLPCHVRQSSPPT